MHLVLRDHLSYETAFIRSLKQSLKTGLTVCHLAVVCTLLSVLPVISEVIIVRFHCSKKATSEGFYDIDGG